MDELKRKKAEEIKNAMYPGIVAQMVANTKNKTD